MLLLSNDDLKPFFAFLESATEAELRDEEMMFSLRRVS